MKWQASEEAQLDGPFLGGALARIGGGASRLMFDSPSTNSGYAGIRAIALHPTTGALEAKPRSGTGIELNAALHGAGVPSLDLYQRNGT